MTNTEFVLDDLSEAPAPEAEAAAPASAPRRQARATRTTARTQPREPVREEPRLKRVRRDNVDPFFVPPDIIPEGFTYQWNAVSVIGNTDVVLDKLMGYYENHWRPVPAERHPGMFVPYGSKGEIIRGGLRLEERPKYLTDEANAEQVMIAKQQMRIQTESVMGRLGQTLGPGMAAPNSYQRSRFNTDRAMVQIDRNLDIPAAGEYTLAEPGQ